MRQDTVYVEVDLSNARYDSRSIDNKLSVLWVPEAPTKHSRVPMVSTVKNTIPRAPLHVFYASMHDFERNTKMMGL